MSVRLFTSEAVSRGHPDKVCDQISDAVLDAALEEDANAHVAIETMVKDQQVVLAGEMTPRLSDDRLKQIARNVIADIGYTRDLDIGFDAEQCDVQLHVGEQSEEIRGGVDQGADDQGAGDQGIIFGYACVEVPKTFLPAPIHYAHALMRQHEAVRATSDGWRLYPDAKSQVTFQYDDEGSPLKVDTVVVSTHHSGDISFKELQDFVREQVIDPVIPPELCAPDLTIYVNPGGKWVDGGGPVADCGLTGRKIIVDTYGGSARHGGGAFSGKDPSKVDRSAAYAARYVARHVIASRWASRCELQLAYAIGKPKPVSVCVNTFGTASGDRALLEDAINEIFDLSAGGITKMLGLIDPKCRPRYEETARHGHFGNLAFPWEKLDLDRLNKLCDALNIKRILESVPPTLSEVPDNCTVH